MALRNICIKVTKYLHIMLEVTRTMGYNSMWFLIFFDLLILT